MWCAAVRYLLICHLPGSGSILAEKTMQKDRKPGCYKVCTENAVNNEKLTNEAMSICLILVSLCSFKI